MSNARSLFKYKILYTFYLITNLNKRKAKKLTKIHISNDFLYNVDCSVDKIIKNLGSDL